MNPKTNLNNTQRKMLDKVYTERLKKRIDQFRVDRTRERAQLLEKFLQDVADKYFTQVLEAGARFAEQVTDPKTQALLKDSGVMLENYIISKPKLVLERSWSAEPPQILKDFDAETIAKEQALRELEDEIRLRIYGSDTQYADIDAEINALLKGVL